MFKPVDEQLAMISEGLVDLISLEELKKKLEASFSKQKPLRVKYGADPSAPDLHLGHTVPLRKLRQFQDLGHQVVFIIGDFTARIGDPSHKSDTRPMLSEEQIKQNALTYQEQVFKILERSKTEVRYNSEWLAKMDAADFLTLTSKYTVARLLERDDFSKRYKEGRPIALVEFMYPMLQGWDSVIVKADIEIGGTDQTFNLLVGRELQNRESQPQQIVMTLPIIEGTDGTQKMSKSLGNHIGVMDSPREMFGKVMSIPDALIERYYTYLSTLSKVEISAAIESLKKGANPRDVKARLGERLVEIFHSKQAAQDAHKEFNEIFKNKGLPEEIAEVFSTQPQMDIISVLMLAQLVPSKSEARRMIEAGAVKIEQEKIADLKYVVNLTQPVVIQCGKRKFAKVVLGSK